MREPILQQLNSAVLTLALIFGLGACGKADETSPAPVSTPLSKLALPCAVSSGSGCKSVDAHVANSIAQAYRSKALLDLLLARYFAVHVSQVDVEQYSAIIRQMLAVACASETAERRRMIESLPLDTVFPSALLENATGAGCGFTEDGNRRTYSPALDH